MENSKFNKSFEEVLLVAGILKNLGSGSLKTLNDRIRVQKLQYFAQIFEVSPYYSYNLYLRGPYSPELANDLYQLKEKHIPIPKLEFVSDEMKERFSRLKDFISGKETRELELLATYHWFIKIAKFKEKDTINKIKLHKNGNDKEINFILSEIKRVPL